MGEEQLRNNNTALSQDPGSALRKTHHNIFELFCRAKTPNKWKMLTTWHWRRLLRVSWTSRRSNQSILKEISPEYPLTGLMLMLKLQYFRHLMQRADWKRPQCWEILKAGGEGDDRG